MRSARWSSTGHDAARPQQRPDIAFDAPIMPDRHRHRCSTSPSDLARHPPSPDRDALAPHTPRTPRSNPHSARHRRASPPAGSFPGGFRTPAPVHAGTVAMGRHPKPFTTPDIRLGKDRAVSAQSLWSGPPMTERYAPAVSLTLDENGAALIGDCQNAWNLLRHKLPLQYRRRAPRAGARSVEDTRLAGTAHVTSLFDMPVRTRLSMQPTLTAISPLSLAIGMM